MHKKGLSALALAVFLLALIGASWWSGIGPVRELLRGTAGDAAQNVERPGDVPACGAAWRMSPSLNPSENYNELHAISAASPTDIWAVGTYGTEQFALTLTEHWDGAKWSHVASPDVQSYSNHLYGVLALSSNEAWAVGASHQGTDLWHTMTMHWDGKAWSFVPSPDVGPISSLNSISAASPTDIWAAGEYATGRRVSGTRALLMHWDGKAWSVVPNPQSEQNGTLNSVVALSADNAWAAGSYSDKSGTVSMPLLLHWDGKSWTEEKSPGVGVIWSLTATSASDIWAVGSYGPQILTMHWDGTQWKLVPGPDLGPGGGSFNGVVSTAPGEAWAVGSQNVGGIDQTLAAHWDGAKWRAVPSPSIGSYLDTLYAATATSDGEVWASGSSIADTQGTNMQIVERYSNPCP